MIPCGFRAESPVELRENKFQKKMSAKNNPIKTNVHLIYVGQPIGFVFGPIHQSVPAVEQDVNQIE